MKVSELYDAFLALINSDEWVHYSEMEKELDWKKIALAAKPWFKFPRTSLDWDETEENFIDEKISNDEIQVWAAFMKVVWYSRVVDSWENLRPLYTERDFSYAKELTSFSNRQVQQYSIAKDLESTYYRSIKGKPFDYSKLAGW